jgi:hypothetical protein
MPNCAAIVQKQPVPALVGVLGCDIPSENRAHPSGELEVVGLDRIQAKIGIELLKGGRHRQPVAVEPDVAPGQVDVNDAPAQRFLELNDVRAFGRRRWRDGTRKPFDRNWERRDGHLARDSNRELRGGIRPGRRLNAIRLGGRAVQIDRPLMFANREEVGLAERTVVDRPLDLYQLVRCQAFVGKIAGQVRGNHNWLSPLCRGIGQESDAAGPQSRSRDKARQGRNPQGEKPAGRHDALP